jgi:hypothetical protein
MPLARIDGRPVRYLISTLPRVRICSCFVSIARFGWRSMIELCVKVLTMCISHPCSGDLAILS